MTWWIGAVLAHLFAVATLCEGGGLAEPAAGKVDHYCDIAQAAVSRFAQAIDRPPYPNALELALELARVRGNDADKALVRKLIIDSPPPAWLDKSSPGFQYSWQIEQAIAYAVIGQRERAGELFDQLALETKNRPAAKPQGQGMRSLLGLTPELELALNRVALGEVTRPFPKGVDLRLYIRMAALFGNRDLCNQLLAELTDAARTASGDERDNAWRDAIDMRIRLGQIDAAMADIPRVITPWKRRDLLSEAADGFALAGEMDKSHAAQVESLRAVPAADADSNLRASELVAIAETAISEGDMEVARQATELAVHEPADKTEAMHERLTFLRVATGLPADLAQERTRIMAMKSSADAKGNPIASSASSQPSDSDTAKKLVLLAAAYAWQGQFEQAKQLVTEVRAMCPPSDLYGVLYEVEKAPIAVADHGDIPKAVTLANELLADWEDRDSTLSNITAAGVRQGKLDDALACLTHFSDTRMGRFYRARSACYIASASVRISAWDRLDALVSSQQDPYTQSVLCLRIARRLQGTGSLGLGWNLP